MKTDEFAATILAAKRTLRARQIERRQTALRGRASAVATTLAEVASRLLASLQHATVSGYHPRNGEIDCLPLLARLGRDGHRTALPVIVGKGQPLLFRAWRCGEPLVAGSSGISEPPSTAPVVVPDVVLTPLLAFDAKGYRLGYGGGYYDRTLAALRQHHAILAIGVAIDELEVDAVPHVAYDQRLDWVLTQTGARRIVTSSTDE